MKFYTLSMGSRPAKMYWSARDDDEFSTALGLMFANADIFEVELGIEIPGWVSKSAESIERWESELFRSAQIIDEIEYRINEREGVFDEDAEECPFLFEELEVGMVPVQDDERRIN